MDRLPELEAPKEQPGAPETVEEPERAEPPSDAPGAQAGVQRRSWWRRLIGG
jgi:hypothetical protein